MTDQEIGRLVGKVLEVRQQKAVRIGSVSFLEIYKVERNRNILSDFGAIGIDFE